MPLFDHFKSFCNQHLQVLENDSPPPNTAWRYLVLIDHFEFIISRNKQLKCRLLKYIYSDEYYHRINNVSKVGVAAIIITIIVIISFGFSYTWFSSSSSVGWAFVYFLPVMIGCRMWRIFVDLLCTHFGRLLCGKREREGEGEEEERRKWKEMDGKRVNKNQVGRYLSSFLMCISATGNSLPKVSK